MVLSISRGSDWTYVSAEVGTSAGNYYSAEVDAGEPPGVWRGSAAPKLGLEGQANDLQLEAVFGEFIDPRDEFFGDRDNWDQAERLGKAPYKFKSREEALAKLVAKEPDPGNVEPERMRQLELQVMKNHREARSFFDATYSPPKSVTALFVACKDQEGRALARGDETAAKDWAAKAATIEDAVWQASGAMITWMENNAGHSRVGYSGAKLKNGEQLGRFVDPGGDASGLTVASFLQHTSRPVAGREAPQLHVHNLIWNRIQCADGKWRTLDGQALYRQRGAAGAVADRELMAHLTRTLGTRWEYDPQSKSHEIAEIGRDVRDIFSPRRQAITKALPKYVKAFTQRMGREPNALELADLAQRATLQTRQRKLRKDENTKLKDKVAGWAADVRQKLSKDLGDTATASIRNPKKVKAQAFDVQDVVDRSLASVQEVKAEWTRSDLMAHVQRHLPGVLADLDKGHQARIVSEIADIALRPDPTRTGTAREILRLEVADLVAAPVEFQLADSTSSFVRPHSARYTTAGLMTAEERLRRRARYDREALRLDIEQQDEAIGRINARLAGPDGIGGARLGDDQEAALRGVLGSGARLETIIGPAGTGKSMIMGSLADVWERETGARVYGLATATSAANILADEGIANASNITKWLGMQDKIKDGKARAEIRARWGLKRGDLVIVDEASMANTASLSAIEEHVTAAGAKLVLVGDDKQQGAVGPGGAFLDVAAAGNRYELSGVRRFHNTWEREASLRLREGDESVVAEYQTQGRIEDCRNLEHAYQRAVSAYVADVLAGKKSYLIAHTNERAADLANQVRAKLVEYQRVEAQGVSIGHKEARSTAGIGDIVQARKNDPKIKDVFNEHITNRDLYEVIACNQETGSLTVRRQYDNGQLGPEYSIPKKYAQRSLTLAYGMTGHTAQGKTGDTSHGIVTPGVSPADVYVPGTRGREKNTFYVADTSEYRDPNAERKPATEIIAEAINRDGTEERSATRTLQDNLEDAGSLRVAGHRLYEANQYLAAKKYEIIVTRHLSEGHAEKFVDDDAKHALFRLMDTLDQAGISAEDVVAQAIGSRELDTARSIAQVVYKRVEKDLGEDLDDIKNGDAAAIAVPEPTGDTYRERVVKGVEGHRVHTYATEWATYADQRATTLGELAANTPPSWALDKFGPVPNDPAERLSWTENVGRVEAYREQYGITADPDVIGRAPGINQPGRRAEWYAAWRALGRPDQTAEERRMSDAQLCNRIADYDAEKQWAPDNVAAELRKANHDIAKAHEQSQHLAAEAATLPADDPRRADLETRAEIAAGRVTELTVERDLFARTHEVRGQWYLATGSERAAADAAARELARREKERAVAPDVDKTPEERQREIVQHREEKFERSKALRAEAATLPADDPRRETLESEAGRLQAEVAASFERQFAREAAEREAAEDAGQEQADDKQPAHEMEPVTAEPETVKDGEPVAADGTEQVPDPVIDKDAPDTTAAPKQTDTAEPVKDPEPVDAQAAAAAAEAAAEKLAKRAHERKAAENADRAKSTAAAFPKSTKESLKEKRDREYQEQSARSAREAAQRADRDKGIER